MRDALWSGIGAVGEYKYADLSEGFASIYPFTRTGSLELSPHTYSLELTTVVTIKRHQ